MGCCYSCEDDGRGPYPNRSTLSSLPSRGAVPTVFDSPRNYTPYYSREDNYERRAIPQRPVVHVIKKPTPTASSTRSTHVPKPIEFKPKPGALYGEFKCGCGYFWVSRLSWRDRYQQCKRCKAHVRPRNQRELRPTDFTSRDQFDDSLAHPQELCEMCKQVGGYCGRYK